MTEAEAKLLACNKILKAVGLPPQPDLDTNGMSAIALAEQCLDDASRRVQANGTQEGMSLFETFATSAGQLTLSSDVLSVKPVGPHVDRKWSVRGNGVLWDAATGTTNQFPSTVYLSVQRKLAFNELTIQTQELIITEAIAAYAQHLGRLQTLKPGIDMMEAKAAVSANQITLADSPTPRAVPPLVLAPQPSRG